MNGPAIGIVVALVAILLGNVLEGGHLGSMVGGPAAMIVLGGTVGAVLVQYPLSTFIGALKSSVATFKKSPIDAHKILEELVDYANRARRDGILALEKVAETASDPFEAKAFEAAGGYAPTVGIIGAVLGLIHVMSNLSDINAVGHGIAAAFVATIYGVAIANIVFLPLAGRIKLCLREKIQSREMILAGVLAIQAGMNPKLVRDRLAGYMHAPAAKGAAPAAH